MHLCGLLCVSYLATAPTAEAWGCRGHETVAALAEKHLTPQAKQALLALLTANPIDPQLKRYCGQTGLDTFVDSSTWASDELAREPPTPPSHFINIPLAVPPRHTQTPSCLRHGNSGKPDARSGSRGVCGHPRCGVPDFVCGLAARRDAVGCVGLGKP